MSVIASLVVGCDGATSKNGNSREISTAEDRQRFLTLRKSAGSIIIGRQTALSDPYEKTESAIYLFTRNATHSMPTPFITMVTPNDDDLVHAVRDIEAQTKDDVLVEAGPTLLIKLIDLGLIEMLFLSITPITGGDNKVDINELLERFEILSDETIESTRLLECRYQGNSPNR